jgi:imidazolonepropionase-like amidohydrolase
LRRFLLGALVLALCLGSAGGANGKAERGAPVLVIRPGRVLEVETGRAHAGWVLRVEGDRIAAVGAAASVAVPKGARVIDLPGATLLPGLIDVHVHLTWDDGLSAASRDAARRTLAAGFTTVRSCGAPGGADLVLRDAIARGAVEGPRVVAAGAPLGYAGGVCAQVFPGDGVFETSEQALAHVRRLAAAGASWVKVCAGGGVVPGPDDDATVEVPPPILAAVVAEAHRLSLEVAAHAQGPAAVAAAARAGVDSIEHGSLLDETAARLMIDRGTLAGADLRPAALAPRAGEGVRRAARGACSRRRGRGPRPPAAAAGDRARRAGGAGQRRHRARARRPLPSRSAGPARGAVAAATAAGGPAGVRLRRDDPPGEGRLGRGVGGAARGGKGGSRDTVASYAPGGI